MFGVRQNQFFFFIIISTYWSNSTYTGTLAANILYPKILYQDTVQEGSRSASKCDLEAVYYYITSFFSQIGEAFKLVFLYMLFLLKVYTLWARESIQTKNLHDEQAR